jgi:predicted nucleotidyltransferase
MSKHLDYLREIAAKLKLGEAEKEKIEISLGNIKEKLNAYFADDGLKEIKPFGSYDRGTLLTRKVDSESDIDILVVFDEKRWESQTYLNKLKRFADENYQRSESYQDHPTIVIELTNIKFELVPCIYKPEDTFYYEKYSIPKKGNQTLEWMETKPNSIKDKIGEYKKTKSTLINLILLYKYWNLVNKGAYSTYQVETFLLKQFDFEKDLAENFFNIIDQLHHKNPTDAQNDLTTKTQKHKSNIELLLENEMSDYAFMELQKLIPDIS